MEAELDLHGMTVEEMRRRLEQEWPGWRGLRRVRVIHGRGAALKPELIRWCEERGVPCSVDGGNPGSTCILPLMRGTAETRIGTTLAEKGLALSAEQEAMLRDPHLAEKARQEAIRKRKEEERRRLLETAADKAKRREEDTLWILEMARLDRMERKRTGALPDGRKPGAPRIVPASKIEHHEGYWRSELVRVADTDHETLKKEKRTGLDKLAPPMQAGDASRQRPVQDAVEPKRPVVPARDTAGDQALFEEALARLDEEW